MITEFKIFELFDTDKVYDYKQTGKDTYTFESSDGTKYYVKIFFNREDKTMAITFTDKKHYLLNKLFHGILKDQFTGKNEPLNILNTVTRIAKDFYDKHSNDIKYFGVAAFTKKRINVYLYIIKKYFKDWDIGEIRDDGGDLYSVTITKRDNNDNNNPDNFSIH